MGTDMEGRTMNEEEWTTSRNPERMLGYLQGRVSERKMGLFAQACLRMLWQRLAQRRARQDRSLEGFVIPTHEPGDALSLLRWSLPWAGPALRAITWLWGEDRF